MNNANGQLILLLFWIVSIACIFLNLHLANIKGRKATTWFVLTIFFGIFATIMLLLAKKEPENQPLDID
ncbi:MAG: hypothetical protein V4683_15745 [Bacteroidota bacterium]